MQECDRRGFRSAWQPEAQGLGAKRLSLCLMPSMAWFHPLLNLCSVLALALPRTKDLFAQLSVPVKEHLPLLVLVLNLASSTSIWCFPVSYLSLSSRPVGSAVPLRVFRLSSRCSALPARMALTAHSRAALSLLCFPGLYLDLGWKRHRVFKIRYKVQFPVILLALTPVDRRLSEERLSWCQGRVLARVCSWHSSMQIISCGTWPCRGGCHKHTEAVEFPVRPLFKVGELHLG